MDFVLNEYHRNISDEDLINDVINVAKTLGVTTLTQDEYAKNGKYHSSTIARRFKNWEESSGISSFRE